jgi:hypothetical protein
MTVCQYSRSHNRITALALGLALGMSAFIGPCWWSIVRFHQPACSEAPADFVAFYTAAKLMLSERAALYDLEVQRSVQHAFNPERPFTAYYYPPILALLLSPLGWLSFSQAFIIMKLVSLSLLWVSLGILIRRLALSRQQSRWLILATLCNYGVYYALLEGQSSFIVLLLLVLYVTAGGTGAGVWSGLLFFISGACSIRAVVWPAKVAGGGSGDLCGSCLGLSFAFRRWLGRNRSLFCNFQSIDGRGELSPRAA